MALSHCGQDTRTRRVARCVACARAASSRARERHALGRYLRGLNGQGLNGQGRTPAIEQRTFVPLSTSIRPLLRFMTTAVCALALLTSVAATPPAGAQAVAKKTVTSAAD